MRLLISGSWVRAPRWAPLLSLLIRPFLLINSCAKTMRQKSSLIVLECTKQKILQVRTTEYPNGLGLTPAIKLLNPHSFCQVLKQSSGNYQTTPTLCCLVTSLFYFQRLLLQCCSAFTIHWSQLLQQLLQTATTSATFVCHYYRFTSVSRFFYRVNHMIRRITLFYGNIRVCAIRIRY